jgi:predicted nucleotidyltransferase component of viral defense system
MIEESYKLKTALVVNTLEHISKEEIFALKGGTAINFFIRNLPRLSEDIDLSYILFDDRKSAFENIEKSMIKIKNSLEKENIYMTLNKTDDNKIYPLIDDGKTQIKIDINYDARGYMFSPEIKKSVSKITENYKPITMKIVSFAELYAGKINAAMSRQHPRDLFDVKMLLNNEGITEAIKNAFIVNTITYRKTPYMLLNPNTVNQEATLKDKFEGMSDIEFTYKDHQETFEKLKKEIHRSFTENDKKFILSFYSLKPQWNLVNIPNIQELPAVKRRIDSLEKMSNEALMEQVEKTKEVFEKFDFQYGVLLS